MHAFWLILTYVLSEDRCIADVTIKTFSILYRIKQIDSMLQVCCFSNRSQKRSKCGRRKSGGECVTDETYCWTDRRTATRNVFVKYICSADWSVSWFLTIAVINVTKEVTKRKFQKFRFDPMRYRCSSRKKLSVLLISFRRRSSVALYWPHTNKSPDLTRFLCAIHQVVFFLPQNFCWRRAFDLFLNWFFIRSYDEEEVTSGKNENGKLDKHTRLVKRSERYC